MRFSRWLSTVRRPIPSSAAISLLVRPRAMPASTSFSRCDSTSSDAASRPLERSARARAIGGEKKVPPMIAVRTAERRSVAASSLSR